MNDDTATAVAQTKEQLSGLPTGTVAAVSGIDIYGNITTQSAEIDRSAKTITVSAVSPGSTEARQLVYVNGLPASQTSFSGLTIAYGHDGLGRIISGTDPRLGAELTAYYTAGAGKIGRIRSQTDAAGNTTVYDYDVARNVVMVQNPLNRKNYYSYNPMGLPTWAWGEAQYPVEFTYNNLG